MVLQGISVLLLCLSKALSDDPVYGRYWVRDFYSKTHNKGWDEHIKK